MNKINYQDITIVCASDDNYAMPLAVTICSVLKNLDSRRSLNLFILDAGIRYENKIKLTNSIDSSRCHLEFLDTKGRFQEMPLVDHLTEATYHRLLIPELLSTAIHKVIYLDCDVLVLTDISKLWDIEIGNHHLLAVQDYSLPYISLGVRNHEEMGIASHCKYFNAGVLVINLDAWRKDSTALTVNEFIVKPRDYKIFNDQEALNAVLWNQWSEIDPKWNQQVVLTSIEGTEKIASECIDSLKERLGEERYLDVISNPYIKHFCSPAKPWNVLAHPDKKLFYQYLDMTKWKGWRYTRINIWSQKVMKKLQKFLSLVNK